MSIISTVRDYLKTCPLFDNIPITVDFLSASPTEVSIDGVPAPHVIKKYTDGSRLCKYSFILGARFPWYGDESAGFSANEWFEEICGWFEEMSNSGFLPKLPAGLTPIKIEGLPNRFDYDGKNSSARYQMICALTFFKQKG